MVRLHYYVILFLLVSIVLGTSCGLLPTSQASSVSTPQPLPPSTGTQSPTPSPGDLPAPHNPTAMKIVLAPLDQTPKAPPPADSTTLALIPTPTETVPPTATTTVSVTKHHLAHNNPELTVTLQHILDAVASSPTHPGVVMYVDVPGQGSWVAARGLAVHDPPVLVKPEDRFRIASVTKMFIAALAVQLVQDGIMTLDDRVEQRLPGLVPNGQHITLRQLLSHTSGLYDYLDVGFEERYFSEDPLRVWKPEELVAYGVSHDTYFAPGEPGKWKYSNTNYILAGMMIEQATGTPLAQLLRQRILEPLELNNTFLEDYEDIPGGFVHGYIGDADYTYASLCTWSAGGLVSTAEDVAMFARGLFGGTLLSDTMLQEMLTFASVDFPARDVYDYPLYGLGVAKSVEALSDVTQGMAPYHRTFDTAWGHIGGLSGFKSIVVYLPDSGVTVVVLMNQMYTQIVPIAIDALGVITQHHQDKQ